jgi:Glyoxalase-like domain
VIGRLHSLVLDCPEPHTLAEFYSELLGLPRLADGPDWAAIGYRAATGTATPGS